MNLTEKQHYIPQVYLRGFSPDNKVKEKKDKYRIYRNKINKEEQLNQLVPIKSICYEKKLYEVTGVDGNIVRQNYLEKAFGYIEKKFSYYKKELENKAFNPQNYQTKCFLKKEEKDFWKVYIVLQILRNKYFLEMAENVWRDIGKDKLNNNQLKNMARLYSLPFFKNEDGDAIFMQLIEPMNNMSFAIGVDYENKIITSDKTACIYCLKSSHIEYEKIIFPISSELCLYMFGGDEKKNIGRNFLFKIENQHREEILKSLSEAAINELYSNHIFDKAEENIIKNRKKMDQR